MTPPSPDQDIVKSLNWFVSYLKPNDWIARKEAITSHLDTLLIPVNLREKQKQNTLKSITAPNDKMAWYLYLAEASSFAPHASEPAQAARVLPIFKRLGIELETLKKIRGLDDRVLRLLNQERNQPDAALFELLVALRWAKDGWKTVEFIPESSHKKTPDLLAKSSRVEWFVECKRLAKSSDYSERERAKWQKIWQPFSEIVKQLRAPFLFDITFHVELDSLSDDFMKRELGGKLKLLVPPCTPISNELWTVKVSEVNLLKARRHLRDQYVKFPSDQLNLLIGGQRDPTRGFTSIVDGKLIRIGEGGHNYFLDELRFAAGAFWKCDAGHALESKSRDIRRHLAKAVEQLPQNGRSVIHIGLETLDGPAVENRRYEKICDTVFKFDSKSKDLRWIYCHLFQSYSPPNKSWVVDETIYYFSNKKYARSEPLKSRALVVDEANSKNEKFHWEKPIP